MYIENLYIPRIVYRGKLKFLDITKRCPLWLIRVMQDIKSAGYRWNNEEIKWPPVYDHRFEK